MTETLSDERALFLINTVRWMLDEPVLDELPLAIPGDPDECLLARALDVRVPARFSAAEMPPCLETPRAEELAQVLGAHYDVERSEVVLPGGHPLSDLERRFERGELPHLIDHKREETEA
jgi:hypothetical protein